MLLNSSVLTEMDIDLRGYEFGLSDKQESDFESGKIALGLTKPPVNTVTKAAVISKSNTEFFIKKDTPINIYFSEKHRRHFFFFYGNKWRHGLIRRGYLYFTKFAPPPPVKVLEKTQGDEIVKSVIGTSIKPESLGANNEPDWLIALSFQSTMNITEKLLAPIEKFLQEISMSPQTNNQTQDTTKNPIDTMDPKLMELQRKLSEINLKIAKTMEPLVKERQKIQAEIAKINKNK